MRFEPIVQFLLLALGQAKGFGRGCDGVPNIFDKLDALGNAELLDTL